MEGEAPSSKLQSTPIGNLTSKIVHSLSPEGSIRTHSERSSLPATLPKQRSPQTGTQAGGRGVSTLSSSLLSALSGADAWSTDKALLASLPPQVAQSLVSKVGPDFDVIGYDLKPGCSREDLGKALAIVSQACEPDRPEHVVSELVRLNSVTQSRERQDTDLEMSYVAMAEGLADFPADVIRDACRAYARCHKWRPSLSELREFCWPRFRARESLRSTLRRAS
jgi:hypothetical protein